MQWKIEDNTKWQDRWLDFRYSGLLAVFMVLNVPIAIILIFFGIFGKGTSSLPNITCYILSILFAISSVYFKHIMLTYNEDEEFKMTDVYAHHSIDMDSDNFGVQYRITEHVTAAKTRYTVEVLTRLKNNDGSDIWKIVKIPNTRYDIASRIDDQNFAIYIYRWYITATPVQDKVNIWTSGRPIHSRFIALPAPAIPESEKQKINDDKLGLTPEEVVKGVKAFREALLASAFTADSRQTPNQVRELYDSVEETVKDKVFRTVEELETELKVNYNEIQKRQEDDWSDY